MRTARNERVTGFTSERSGRPFQRDAELIGRPDDFDDQAVAGS
jgi:hypothetical protein